MEHDHFRFLTAPDEVHCHDRFAPVGPRRIPSPRVDEPRRRFDLTIRPHHTKRVTVTGMVSDMRGVKGLYVHAAELGGEAVPMEEKKP